MVRATNGLSLRSLLDELATRGVSNWGFYDPIMTERILRRSAHELRGSELAARLLTRATRSVLGSNANLGTVNDDLSASSEGLDPGNWQVANRPSTQSASIVFPGQETWFVVQLRAPNTPGTYTFAVRPVIDGITWMEDLALSITLTVDTTLVPTPVPTMPAVVLTPKPGPLTPAGSALPDASGYHARWIIQSPWPVTAPGQTTEWAVAFLNTGSAPWRRGVLGANAALGVVGDSTIGDQQGLNPGNWQVANRPAIQDASVVNPGEIGWFIVQLHAPATPGTYTLALRPVIDGVAWLEDYGVFFTLTVQTVGTTQFAP